MRHLACQTADDRVEYEIYVDVYHEWLKLMVHLGSTISMAFTDLITKANCMASNRLLCSENLGFIQKTDSQFVYIYDFIKFEQSIGIHRINGANHTEELKETFKNYKNTPIKKDMESLFKDYQSTARTMQRGAWFFDFVEYILKEFCEHKELSLSQVIRNSYNDNLCKYHNWFIRQGANWAVGLANSREVFNKEITQLQCEVLGRKYSQDEFYNDLKEMKPYITIVTKHIWDWFKRNELQNLP